MKNNSNFRVPRQTSLRQLVYRHLLYRHLLYRHLVSYLSAVGLLPNLFSTAAHFLGTTHQTAHCIYRTYFIYKTYILLHIFLLHNTEVY